MSLWVRRRDADGKSHQYAIPFDPLVLMGIIGISIGFTLSLVLAFRDFATRQPVQAACLLTFALAIGFAMFATAKLSVIVSGVLFSFGPARMTRSMRRLYFGGYTLIACAAFLAMILTT